MFDDPKLEAPLPQPRVDALARAGARRRASTPSSSPARCSPRTSPRGWPRASTQGSTGTWSTSCARTASSSASGRRSSDSVFVDVGWTAEPRIALIRSGSFEPAETGGTAEVEERQAEIQDFSLAADHGRAGARGVRGAVDRGRRHRRRRRPRAGRARSVLARRGPGQGARRRGRGDARRRRRRLVSVRDPGRPDRAERCRRSSTSRAASPARSSTRSACRARA